LTLLRINKETELAIIEMGANHVGEIDFLCRIAEPIYGLITNIGRAHLEGFGSFEGVIEAKTELFRYLDKEDHYAIINMDDKSLIDYSKRHQNKFYTYSIEEKTYSETASINYKGIRINSNLVGSYNSQNLLAAIIVGEIFEVPLNISAKAIEDYKPNNHRSQIQKTKNNTLILDCYNANPSSLSAALKDFENLKANKKYAFIGAMKELGACSEQEHKHIVEILEKMNLDEIVLVGKEFEKLKTQNMLWFNSSVDTKEYFSKNKIIGSTILIKGSNSTKMEVIADVL
ncbi:MAG TPA: UDP-N-acetylmuramoyl-tripeptide--D-alanyl-D-alanine ligase, partial [Bacteroidales bacterium]|nr:UDP-N-acetylmuramoyl-tripeptide--D-alanyl-D-alanine ligase [Bacteroidales bacterium]